jgi:hypothetical protein
MASPSLASFVSEQLRDAPAQLEKMPALIGFDGFVDTILHVVACRESATKFVRMSAMREFSSRIGAAAGHSANFEFVTQIIKLGGNGPIMANALGKFGLPITYIGNLGSPNIHPVFQELASCAEVHSIAEPGFTDALEFDDGKLMFGKHESLKQIDWANLIAHVPEERLLGIISHASLTAFVNWTMLPHMSAIWNKILTRMASRLRGPKRWLFFDLADPAKRSRNDLALALRLVSRFEKYFRVILGMNLQESRQVGEVLGFKPPDELYGAVTNHAELIQRALKIDTVVIHPTHFAAAADRRGAGYLEGPFTAKPKLTTGAGDHFNAGFCLGRLLDMDLDASLQLGVSTSGFYVRNARSPGLDDLRKFLRPARKRQRPGQAATSQVRKPLAG